MGKEDSFVPIETISKVEEIDLMKIQPEEKTLEEQDCQNKLLEIQGLCYQMWKLEPMS